MKSFEYFSEDIEARRAALKLRQIEQGTSFKERSTATQDVSRRRMADQRTRLANIQQRQKAAKAAGMTVQQFAKHVDDNKDKYSTRTERQANLAQTFAKMRKEGADFDALSQFLVNEGADQSSVNHVLANWVSTKEDYWMEFEEGYQRNPEKGEEEERKAEKRRRESGRMPPRGDKRREDFEKWYAANVR